MTLELQLENAERAYAPGEPVRGVVIVTVAEPTNCNDLDLAFVMNQSSEHGASRSHRVHRHSLVSTHDWNAGRYQYPFERPAPDWPPNHIGQMVQFQWTLTVVADIPMALNVEVSIPVRVELAHDAGWRITQDSPGDPSERAGTPFSAGGLTVLVVGTALGGVGAITDTTAILLAGITLGTVALFYVLMRWMKVSAVGAPQLAVNQTGTEHDPRLECTLWVKEGATIEAAACALLVFERHRIVRPTGGSGKSTSSHRHTVLNHQFSLNRTDDGVYKGELCLAELGPLPYSYATDATSTCIGWSMIPTIRSKGTVYSGDIYDLSARPAIGPGSVPVSG